MFAEESLVKNDNSIEQIREKVWIPKRHPHVGGIELTPYCNLRCVHCYLQDQEKHTLLTTEEVKYIIDKLFDVGVLFLYFTGGEILTRSDFFEIYIYAKKKGFIIELLTNGTLIDSKAIEIFNKYPPASISISIYGKDEESYFRVTGQNGMYNKVINTLKMLSQNSIHFEIKYIGMRENQDDYPAICSLAERYGAEFSYSMELFPTLNGNECTKNHMISLEKIIANLKTCEIKLIPFMAGRVINFEKYIESLNSCNIDTQKINNKYIKIKVIDKYIKQNNSLFKISVYDNKIKIQRVEEDYDIELDINSITQLAFSYLNTDEIFMLNEIDESSLINTQKELLNVLFEKRINYIDELV